MVNELKRYSKSGREFTDKDINVIKQIVSEKFHTSRVKISEAVCRELNWYSENGKPKAWVCREFLLDLEKDCLIKLPLPKSYSFNRLKKKKFDTEFIVPIQEFNGKLGNFSKPKFRRVNSKFENTYWEYLVNKYHYLGYKGVMGRFLKYLVYIDDVPVAALGWSGAAINVGSRDLWIGWDSKTRMKNIKHIVNNFRFIIFPWAKIKYLASHLLGANIPILIKDWKVQYNVDVFLLETFVQKDRFRGTSYKAANWIKVGETKGFAKKKKSYEKHGIIKDVYLYAVKDKDLNFLRCHT